MKYAHPYTKTAQGVLMDWSDYLPREAFVALDNVLSLATDAAKDVEAERDALAERVEALRKALIQIDNVTGLVQDKHSARDCRWISSKALCEDGEAHRRLVGDAPPLPGALDADDAERGDG